MAVKFTSVKCPECGANLPIEEGRERIFCSYCGTPVIITNENEKIIRHVDEAKIKRAETERIVQLEQIELEKHRLHQEIEDAERASKLQNIFAKIWVIIVIVLLCICIGLLFLQGDDGFSAFLFLFYIGAPHFWHFIMHPSFSVVNYCNRGIRKINFTPGSDFFPIYRNTFNLICFCKYSNDHVMFVYTLDIFETG